MNTTIQTPRGSERTGKKATRPLRLMTSRKFLATLSVLAVGLVVLAITSFKPVIAATAPVLGTVDGFAILGASAVTNTGPTSISRDLGVSPGNAVTGFPPGIVGGTIHAGDAVAAQAQSDALIAYNALAGQPCDTILTDQDLGGLTLTAGVYCYAASAQLTGAVTLDAQGDPNAVFIFQIGSTLTTASASSVLLINGSAACNVFFQVGSSATLGTDTRFIGNIFALASVTLTTRVRVSGRAVALNGAVTLDSNVISVPTCEVPTATPTPTATLTPTATPASTATAVPTVAATAIPTASATSIPTVAPAASATAVPTATVAPAAAPAVVTTAASSPAAAASAAGAQAAAPPEDVSSAAAAAVAAASGAAAAAGAPSAGSPSAASSQTGAPARVVTPPLAGSSSTLRPPATGSAGFAERGATSPAVVWLLSVATVGLALTGRGLVSRRTLR